MEVMPASDARARALPASIRACTLVVLASVWLVAVVAPASAHDDDDGHDHGHSHADAVVWEGAGSGLEDCETLDPGRIRWVFDPGDDHHVTYAELHIDEPEANVWPIEGPPFEWVTPYYDFDLIEADADGFDGAPGDDATLAITGFCPTGLAHTGVPVFLLVLLGLAALGGGAALVRRR